MVPGLHLLRGIDPVALEEGDGLFGHQLRQGVGGGGEVQKASRLGLLDPGFVVTVAVKEDPLVGLEGFLEQGGQGGGEVFGSFQAVSEPFQFLGHHGVEDDVGPGDRVRGAYHPELKFVAGEGHGGGAVAVGVVLADVGQGGQAHVQHPLAQIHMVRALQEGVNHLGELVPQEDRDHRRGCLLGAQTVVVA